MAPLPKGKEKKKKLSLTTMPKQACEEEEMHLILLAE